MKFRSFISICLIACAALMATLLPTTASAKQCVWNKGGYALNVHWYRLNALSADPAGGQTMGLLRHADPAKSDSLAVGQGSCTTSDEPHLALLQIPACLTVQTGSGTQPCNLEGRDTTGYWALRIPVGLVLARHHPAVGAGNAGNNARPTLTPPLPVDCVQPANGYCFYKTVGWQLPRGTFLLTQPPTTHYLDFWGTVWTVQWGQGGPITP